MYTLEQLACFVATVDQGSFSAAARVLGKVQSAVSQQIINLEVDSNQTLFTRSGRYPELTEAGKQLLPYAQAVLAQQKLFEQQLTLLESRQPARLTLALDEGIPAAGLKDVLITMAAEFPGLAFETLSASSPDIIELVQQGRAGTGLVFSSLEYPSLLHFDSVGTVTFDILVSPQHPLALDKPKHTDQLKLHRQLVIGARNQVGSAFNYPLSPDVWQADNYYMLNELTKAGLGWAMLPQHIAAQAITEGSLIKLPVDAENLSWQANVDLIQHPADAANQASKRLRQLMQGLL
ncbi:MAG: LysR family transcriptional regulator [Shewanella sp.]|nr:LysR family transcriptional regulator [Shewanella sp.]MCF1430006.1 LysR family transcriptional regulator [Shewanella sp.]MCF1438047.1 LysR family transcriptional regulator [Shewanella sp.]MCF1456418.1 LysR family transcriptional regulator [Shewanella sp.]